MIKKGLALVVIVGVAYGGYRWGPLVFPHVERALGLGEAVWIPAPDGSGAEQPTAEIADATLDRFQSFRRGDGSERLALSGTELSSVIRYALPGMIPPGVDDTTVRLDDGRVHVSARVALAAFPRLPRLDQVMGMLPDTVLVEMEGTLVPLDQSFMALLVDRVEAGRIPVPKRMVAEVLAALGREGPPSLPTDAISVPIPDGVTSVFVQQDSLVLLGQR